MVFFVYHINSTIFMNINFLKYPYYFIKKTSLLFLSLRNFLNERSNNFLIIQLITNSIQSGSLILLLTINLSVKFCNKFI